MATKKSKRAKPPRQPKAASRINGVVVTLLDIDVLKHSLADSEHARSLAESIVATVREPLLVLDGQLHVKMANRSFYDLFHVKPAETEDRFIYKLGDGQWDLPELRELLEKILPAQTTLEDFPFEAKFPGVGRKKLLLNARSLVNPDNGTDWILLAMQEPDGRK
jgi:two-component system CheB/CheR fusion protein